MHQAFSMFTSLLTSLVHEPVNELAHEPVNELAHEPIHEPVYELTSRV